MVTTWSVSDSELRFGGIAAEAHAQHVLRRYKTEPFSSRSQGALTRGQSLTFGSGPFHTGSGVCCAGPRVVLWFVEPRGEASHGEHARPSAPPFEGVLYHQTLWNAPFKPGRPKRYLWHFDRSGFLGLWCCFSPYKNVFCNFVDSTVSTSVLDSSLVVSIAVL